MPSSEPGTEPEKAADRVRPQNLRYSIDSALRFLGFGAPRRMPAEPGRLTGGRSDLLQFSGESANVDFWHGAHSDRFWDGQPVLLSDLNLTEWVPSQPGVYHLPDAREARVYARRFVNEDPRIGTHYIPKRQQSMVQGGVGTCRLGQIETTDGSRFLVGVTSTMSCQEGIPVMIAIDDFASIADDLRSMGSVQVDIRGRVRLVGRSAFVGGVSRFRPETFYVAADSMRVRRAGLPNEILASAFITFGERFERKPEWLTTFCQFHPGSLAGLNRAIESPRRVRRLHVDRNYATPSILKPL